MPWRKLPACDFGLSGNLEAYVTGKFSSAARLKIPTKLEPQQEVAMIRIRFVLVFAVCAGLLPSARGQEFRRLPIREYRDKMKAGWPDRP
jgi:hypothetical protein